MESAARGDWADAVAAFSAAVDAAADPQEQSTPDVLALVLGNLANACFRAGSLSDGIRHAQRACAIRVALAGEDATSAARARSDLAVMLCAAGRGDEAAALIARAIANVERSVGEDDVRLVSLFENAARVALSLGHLDAATAPLDRLHALLALHGLPTGRALELQTRVAKARAKSTVVPPDTLAPMVEMPIASHDREATPVPPIVSTPVVPDPPVVPHEADPSEHEPRHDSLVADGLVDVGLADVGLAANGLLEVDDQPLRDAVAVTDVLLRTTPRGVAIIREETAPPSTLADALPDDVELTATFAQELERDLQATLPTARAASSAEPHTARALGFAIEHGFTGYEEHHLGAAAASSESPTVAESAAFGLELTLADPVAPATLSLVPATFGATEPSPAAAPVPVAESRFAEPAWSPPSGPAGRGTPRGIAIVLPSPHGGAPTIAAAFGGTSVESGAERADAESTGDAAEANSEETSERTRRPFGAALRAGRAAAPQSSHGMLIAAAITIAAGAAATWIFLQSGR